MGTLIILILESSVCLAAYYILYKGLFSKETFHRFNRVTLLLIMLLTAGIPVVASLVENSFLPVVVKNAVAFAEAPLLTGVVLQQEDTSPLLIPVLLLLVYVVGIVVVLAHRFRMYYRLLRLIASSKGETLEQGARLYVHQQEVGPFSWFGCIVVSENDLKENRDIILTHEKAHIQLRHSIDLLLADLCILVQWFNPAAWLLKQELQAIHEFEADEAVLNHGIDAQKYQLLIIKKAVGTRLYSMANSFNHSSLKKRITMMMKEKSNPVARWKFAVVLPLGCLAVLAFAQPAYSEFKNRSANQLNDVVSQSKDLIGITPASEDKGNSPTSKNESKHEKSTQMLTASFVDEANADENATQIAITSEKEVKNDVISIDNINHTNESSPKDQTKTDLSIQTIPENTPPPPPVIKNTQKITVADVMPEFPGGLKALASYISDHMNYPQLASENGITGQVICQFLVNTNGKISDVKIIKGLSLECDAEAKRVVSEMPDWIPGTAKGKKVAVNYVLPIKFNLIK